MERFCGMSVREGIAIGNVYFYRKYMDTPYREQIEEPEREIDRFDAACAQALTELDALIQDAASDVGSESAAVFEGHQMLVKDPLYREYVTDVIRTQKVNAEYAVADAQAHFVRMLLGVDDSYLRERSADVEDVSKRLLRILCGGMQEAGPKEPSILVADELTPSETMGFDRTKILAFVLRQGSSSSHTAILARAMNIPAVFGVEVSVDWEGRMAVVDGDAGEVFLDPDADCLARMEEKQNCTRQREANLEKLRGEDTVTKGGRRILLYANIGNVSDADEALLNDAEGIGLFRSEFLYLQAQTLPTEEEQFEIYRAVAETMDGKEVVIRTLDAGTDKQLPCLDLPPEKNPAIGYRGIRICLDMPEMFRAQLRAILRAAACGNVSVMFPMIVSTEEVAACKKQLALAKEELSGEQIPYGDVRIGVMIETPAAALISDTLAREVDFFCVGTNDLTSYILAADRQDARLGAMCDPRDPAVMEALRLVLENGHKAGIPVGICGEAAADETMTELLVAMGFDEFSVAPGALLKIREAVREIDD